MSKFLTIKEVAEKFNVSKGTISRLMDRRKIPFFKIGGSIRFSKEDVNQFLEDNKKDWNKYPNLDIYG